ncbi:hypothetical protein N657DRAFT_643643 [Parathielavia appendiculata]|uniref:Uncharacterized protein n=1 Tax=Parathielavia appendiculata TaxID=2587402 RepID=A0AAN6Z4P3_9PEZI|nr:hypothetical protein N657DRAFT_643643 [Parathielavia appendiculata]
MNVFGKAFSSRSLPPANLFLLLFCYFEYILPANSRLLNAEPSKLHVPHLSRKLKTLRTRDRNGGGEPCGPPLPGSDKYSTLGYLHTRQIQEQRLG